MQAFAVHYSLPFIQEALYIVVTSIAAQALYVALMWKRWYGGHWRWTCGGHIAHISVTTNRWARGAKETVSAMLVLGGASMLLWSIPLDAVLCGYLGNPFGNLLTPAFLGCDIAFLGLLYYAVRDPKRKTH